jgi:flagellum-specific peptidoglycan hydrolase FlgJ
MYKKIILVVVMVTFIGCNTSKSVIVTTKDRDSKPTTAHTNSPKKTTSVPKKESSSEVIESTSKTVVTTDLINGYIFHYKDIAMSNMRNFGIPASIILAQGILESGAGLGKLAATANNHFGIKCYTDWTGETTLHDDDASQECFRKYNNPEESYQDHAAIVSKRSRYASLFKLPKGDYKAWAKGLKDAGYATDPRYPDKLISYIERYHLDQFDNVVLGKEIPLEEKLDGKIGLDVKNSNNKPTQYVVVKGDTLYSISKKFNISIEALKKENNIFDNAISIGQNLKID